MRRMRMMSGEVKKFEIIMGLLRDLNGTARGKAVLKNTWRKILNEIEPWMMEGRAIFGTPENVIKEAIFTTMMNLSERGYTADQIKATIKKINFEDLGDRL